MKKTTTKKKNQQKTNGHRYVHIKPLKSPVKDTLKSMTNDDDLNIIGALWKQVVKIAATFVADMFPCLTRYSHLFFHENLVEFLHLSFTILFLFMF